MKTKLLVFFAFATLYASAQQTYNLDWFAGIGSNVDLTIESGDTVIWTWTSPNHTVENIPGSSVETFNSGFLGPTGSTYEYTFTVIGDNDYFCSVHGEASMSGTITVVEELSVEDNVQKLFQMASNVSSSTLSLNFGQVQSDGVFRIFDLLGKQVATQSFQGNSDLEIDISAMEKGIYLLLINSDGKQQTQRFIKQ